ncbi:hypothetical protein ACEPAF_5356 [Sanghuangporus sanghuang]
MVMQSDPASSRQALKSSPTDLGRAKRARTKHACDECRRSQKKCDGDKPLCRRCYLNGTHCTYTPHKSRNQCLCTGQGEEIQGDSFVPDVFVFADQSQSSFHTWSATGSPNQSPTVSDSLLQTPPPTNLSQDDRFGTVQNAVLQLPEIPYESEIVLSTETIHCGRNIYNHRSYSLPSFLSASSISTSPPATEYSSHAASGSLSGNLAKEGVTPAEAKFVPPGYSSGLDSERNLGAAYLSSHCDITHQIQELSQRSVESGTLLDVSAAHHGQQAPQMHLSQRRDSVLTPDRTSVGLPNGQVYSMPQYTTGQTFVNSLDSTSSSSSSSSSMNCSSGVGDAAGAYSQWLAQVHASGVFCSSSDIRNVPSLGPTSQSTCLGGGTRTDYSFFDVMGQSTELYSGLTRARTSDLLGSPASNVTRQHRGMMLQNLPSPHFSHNQWVNGPVSPPLSGSYPGSADPSPSACSTNSFPGWSQ